MAVAERIEYGKAISCDDIVEALDTAQEREV